MLLLALQGRPICDGRSETPLDARRICDSVLPPVAANSLTTRDAGAATEAFVSAYAVTAAHQDITRQFGASAWFWLAAFLRRVAPEPPLRAAIALRAQPRQAPSPAPPSAVPHHAYATRPARAAHQNAATIPLRHTPESSLFANALATPRGVSVLVLTNAVESASPAKLVAALQRLKSPLVLTQRVLPPLLKELFNKAGALYFDRLGLNDAQCVVDVLGVVPFQDMDDFLLTVNLEPQQELPGVRCTVHARAQNCRTVLVISRADGYSREPACTPPSVTPSPLAAVVPASVGPLVDCLQFRIIVALCVLEESRRLQCNGDNDLTGLVAAERGRVSSDACEEFVGAITLASRVFSF